MNRLPAILCSGAFAVVLTMMLVGLLTGCANTDTPAKPSPVHAETAKIQANADAASKSIAAADGKLSTVEASPNVPAPEKATVTSARADLGTAAKATNEITATNVPAANKAADDEKGRLEKVASDAADKQRRRDEFIGAIITGFAVAGLVMLAVERFTHCTYVIGAIAGAIVGALAFALFGKVLALVSGLVTVLFWVAVIGGGVVAVLYLIRRYLKGGAKGLIRNVELLNHQPAADPAAKGA